MKKFLVLVLFCLSLSSCNDRKQKKHEPEDISKTDHQMSENELHLSDQQIQLGNITVDSVREHALGEEFLITGVVTVNQNQAYSIASRVMGRIEKLYFKNIGEVIRKGDVLYEIYSEELNIAVRELLLAGEKSRSLKNEQVDLKKILESARSKLRLYGLSEAQIKDLEKNSDLGNTIKIYSPISGVITSIDVKEGDYLMEGMSVFHLADLSPLWVEGQLYSGLDDYVKEGMIANISFPGSAKKNVVGKISFINPELSGGSKTNSVRIEITNKDNQLKPGTLAYISVLPHEKTALAVPTNAILRDGKGETIWIKTGENMFKSKMVHTGLEANGYTEIIHGLEQGEQVVVTGAYLLNSEFIFSKGTNPMEGHDMSSM